MNIIEIVIGFIGGGGVATLLTMPSIIKKAKAESESSIMQNYSKFVEEIRREQTETRARLDSMEKVSKLQYETIMKSFLCKLPNDIDGCPVQESFKKLKEM